MQLARRMDRLGTETAFEVLARAKQLEAEGRSVVHLEIGEPDFNTPQNIVDAGSTAIREGWTHYGPSAGLPQLREAVAAHVNRTRGTSYGPENVVVTPGGKPVMFFGLLAMAEQGDEVIYPNPGFPIYESMIKYCGAKPVPLRLREERAFGFDVNELEDLISTRTKMVILNFPQNPTGGMLDAEETAELVDMLRRQPHVGILSDEIYSEIIYEGEHTSVLQHEGMAERTMLLDGFSKTYAMTGWRLGYGVMPAPIAEQVARLQTNSTSCTAAFTQIAGVEALTGDHTDVRNMVEQFKGRRDVIVDGLNAIPGITCLKPRGAFYVFPNIQGTGMNAKDLQDRLLEEAGVACLAGTSFGEFGEGHLRFSYANSVEAIQDALGRIGKFVAENCPNAG